LGDNINNIKKNTEALTGTRKVAGLEVHTEETKYILMSHHQNAWKNHNIQIAEISFEILGKLKYLGMTATNQNLIHEKIKRRLNSGNACYHSVQNLLSSHLLSENIKIVIHKTIILPVVLHECETWTLTLSEEYILRVSNDRVLRRSGLKRDEMV
jgi:hypothetical protein